MKKTMISVVISLLFSAALLSGIDPLEQFAFYVNLVMNVLAWIFLLLVGTKDEIAAGVRRHAWVKAISSTIALYALVFSGHPVLAASSFMVQFFILLIAFQKKAAA